MNNSKDISYKGLTDLESYFSSFRNKVVGHDLTITTPYGDKPLVYADWIASGRLYQPIEDILCNQIGPYVANTTPLSDQSKLAIEPSASLLPLPSMLKNNLKMISLSPPLLIQIHKCHLLLPWKLKLNQC